MTTPIPALNRHDSAETNHSMEIARGERFEFGKNWESFLAVLNDDRINVACESLTEWLGSIEGATFLDIGCGSGLFSLAAMRLGATAVISCDYDPHSVACARELKRRYFANDRRWTILEGSCLDRGFVDALPKSEIVYIWGVAHHTGDMWTALDNVSSRVAPNGQLFTAIYNDQGYKSRAWRSVKRLYCSGWMGRALVLPIFIAMFFATGLIADAIRLRNPIIRYAEYKKRRGMSLVHDWYDWLGGYPYEVAKAEQVFDFFRNRGFMLERLRTNSGHGNNELVFRRINDRF